MSLRTDLLAVEDSVMSAVLSPTGLDVTPHQLVIETRTWIGGVKGKGGPGNYTTADLTLGQYFNVRQLTMREVSNSGGRYREGDVIVEDIVPFDGVSVGYTKAQLAPSSATDGVEIVHILQGFGPLVGEYALVQGRFDDPLAYHLILRARRTTP